MSQPYFVWNSSEEDSRNCGLPPPPMNGEFTKDLRHQHSNAHQGRRHLVILERDGGILSARWVAGHVLLMVQTPRASPPGEIKVLLRSHDLIFASAINGLEQRFQRRLPYGPTSQYRRNDRHRIRDLPSTYSVPPKGRLPPGPSVHHLLPEKRVHDALLSR